MARGLLATEAGQTDDVSALADRSSAFEGAPAEEIIAWVVDSFGDGLSLACSFQDVVVLDLALAVRPEIEVVFLDTGAHFQETLDFLEDVQARYQMNLVVLHPGPDADDWPCGSPRCCEVRKVAPLRAHLATRSAWMTGLRRADGPTRRHAPIVSLDPNFSVVKVNPLATWSDEQVARYAEDRGLPVHPLVPEGFASIGCAPTTSPVGDGQDGRAGRWAGLEKTECGLHS